MIYKYLSKITSILSPEFLHDIFILSLKLDMKKKKKRFKNLEFEFLGKKFDNPLGLAAGFDKNAEVIKGTLNLGFGFVEVGTVTPMPQKGNPKPRVFKIPEYEAVIQRLGFNNKGIESFLENLLNYRKLHNSGIVGVNIGKNKNNENFFSDYKFLFKLVSSHADYVTINISSPNTLGLRDLQKKGIVEELIKIIIKVNKKKVPTFVKISPDISDVDLENICKISVNEKLICGLIISNTTVGRDMLFTRPVRDSWKIKESGGLSGPPLSILTNDVIKKVFSITKGKIKIIGVGGVSTGKDVFEKLSLGCNLVQLYTALIYKGPNVVSNILSELSILIEKNGFSNVSDLIGKNIKL